MFKSTSTSLILLGILAAGPSVIARSRPRLIRPLRATAALAWSDDLPRPLQQILFDTAESIPSPGPGRRVEPELEAVPL